MITVIARARDADHWARLKRIPRDQYRVVSHPRDLYGLPRGTEVVTTGPWWLCEGSGEMADYLQAIGATLRHDDLDALSGGPPERCRS